MKRSALNVDKLLDAFGAGKASRADIVRAIRGSAAGVSSVPELLARLFPDIELRWRMTHVSLDRLLATEVQLEQHKYRLVAALFPDAESFDRVDRELFPGFPLTGVLLGDSHVALIDGHHRVRRFSELAPPDAEVEIKLLIGRDPEIQTTYLRQVEAVEHANGSASINDLPIRG